MATERNGDCNDGRLFSIYPPELTFEPEPGKACFCDMKVINTTEHHVAFKVKTTAPKKYLVRPNKGVVQPWDSQIITVTRQAVKLYPEDTGSKDKFLIQSTVVRPATDFDELPPNTFADDGIRKIEEQKVGVVCKVAKEKPQEDEPCGVIQMNGISRGASDSLTVRLEHRLKEEVDTALRQNQQLKRELDCIRKACKRNEGFSLKFTIFAGFVGMLVGLILNLVLT